MNAKSTVARRCIDSDTQVMTPNSAGGTVTCGNCGQQVTVVEKKLLDDPNDHNTWLAIDEHIMSGD
jgi:transcription elongation factor Elf1